MIDDRKRGETIPEYKERHRLVYVVLLGRAVRAFSMSDEVRASNRGLLEEILESAEEERCSALFMWRGLAVSRYGSVMSIAREIVEARGIEGSEWLERMRLRAEVA